MRPIPLLLALFACGGTDGAQELSRDATLPDEAPRRVDLRIDVIPSALRDGADGYRALPQSLLPAAIPVGSSFSLNEIALLPPVVQSGSASVFKINPLIAAIPGEPLPLAGTVQLRRLDTIQWYTARPDEQGNFDLWAVPGSYRLDIIPDDPLMPMYTSDWTVNDPSEPISLDLEAGVPIYGRVSSPGGPIAGAKVYVESEDGTISAPALTDAYGLYQLRVAPGDWSLVCEGRALGRDPILRFTDLVVGDAGLNHDIVYPTDTAATTHYLEGQIINATGEAVKDATIRVIAESIADYESLDASFEALDTTVVGGSFVVSVIPGSYTIEVMPPNDDLSDEPLTPFRQEGIEVRNLSTSVGAIALGRPRTLTGSVRGPNGSDLGSARIDCTEIGFDGRNWFTFTEKGEFEIELPDTALECRVDPPGDRSDLARIWRTIEPSQGEPGQGDPERNRVDFELPVGERISGTVLYGDKPEAYVVIDVLDLAGRSLGSGLTLDDGVFSIPVDLQSAK